MGNSQANSGTLRRSSLGRTGFPLPSIASARTTRVAQRGMEGLRPRPSRKVLFADARRKEAARTRVEELGTAFVCRSAAYRERLGRSNANSPAYLPSFSLTSP